MFLVWSVVFWKTGSFRKSTIAALVTGKTFAVVYKLAGLDRVVYTLYIIHRRTGYVREVHITAVEVLLLSFLASLLVALYWPVLSRYAPRELKTAMEPT